MRFAIAGVVTSTSVATARPEPLARFTSVWQTTPCRVRGELRAHLPLLVRREDVDDAVDGLPASCVCRVAKTRWPVSAAVSATEIVSRSRSSPMRMTSGSWRSTCLSAFAKLCVSWPTSRWLTSDFWLRVQELDRVLDRHDVVGAGAVHEVDERGERRRLARTGRAGDEHETARRAWRTGATDVGDRRASSSGLISVGIRRKAPPIAPRCW